MTVEISFLTKVTHDVWSKLIFLLTVLLKNTVRDYLQLVGWKLNGRECLPSVFWGGARNCHS